MPQTVQYIQYQQNYDSGRSVGSLPPLAPPIIDSNNQKQTVSVQANDKINIFDQQELLKELESLMRAQGRPPMPPV